MALGSGFGGWGRGVVVERRVAVRGETAHAAGWAVQQARESGLVGWACEEAERRDAISRATEEMQREEI